MLGELNSCLQKLPARDQELIRKRYSPQATAQSVAADLSRPVRWVYKAVSRIRKLLLDCMTRQLNLQRKETG